MAISSGDALAWGRLGDALTQRRLDLDLRRYRSRVAFCDDKQIDYRVIFDIEKAKRDNFGRATLQDVARAYEVTRASMDRVLHQEGDLEPAPQPDAASGSRPSLRAVPAPEPSRAPEMVALPADMAPMMQDTALQLTVPQIYARARAVLARNPHATGRDIFPCETEAPKIWDRLRRDDAFTLDECALYAAVGHLEEERRKWRTRHTG